MSTTRVTVLFTAILLFSSTAAIANTYGSVEPIANDAVLNTELLRSQPLGVRAAFAQRALQCGLVDNVIEALSAQGAVTTINALNTHFSIAAGGFAGETNPSYVYVIIDEGPNAASHTDIKVLTDSLGYVLSQGSAFLLDADNAETFDFPANYVVLNFPAPPSMEQSAALFETVGRIDRELFQSDSSGYTQYGRAYLSLQSFVSNDRFISGYVRAAAEAKVEYTPIVGGLPSMFRGGAAFPGNDWAAHPAGEEYLARIPAAAHAALTQLRNAHLSLTRDALRMLTGDAEDKVATVHRRLSRLSCR